MPRIVEDDVTDDLKILLASLKALDLLLHLIRQSKSAFTTYPSRESPTSICAISVMQELDIAVAGDFW
jgi:hypothetical protein